MFIRRMTCSAILASLVILCGAGKAPAGLLKLTLSQVGNAPIMFTAPAMDPNFISANGTFGSFMFDILAFSDNPGSATQAQLFVLANVMRLFEMTPNTNPLVLTVFQDGFGLPGGSTSTVNTLSEASASAISVGATNMVEVVNTIGLPDTVMGMHTLLPPNDAASQPGTFTRSGSFQLQSMSTISLAPAASSTQPNPAANYSITLTITPGSGPVVVVPEPTSLVLVCSAVPLLAAWTRRKRWRQAA